jgi:hypothetical protein
MLTSWVPPYTGTNFMNELDAAHFAALLLSQPQARILVQGKPGVYRCLRETDIPFNAEANAWILQTSIEPLAQQPTLVTSR